MDYEAQNALREIAAIAGRFGQIAAGLDALELITDEQFRIVGLLALAEGARAGGFHRQAVNVIEPLLDSVSMTRQQWEQLRVIDTLVPLLVADGRMGEANRLYEQTKAAMTGREALAEARLIGCASALGRATDLAATLTKIDPDSLDDDLARRDVAVALLQSGQVGASADFIKAIVDATQRCRAIEVLLEYVDGRTWRDEAHALIGTLRRAPERARALTALALRLLELRVQRGVQQVIDEALSWSKRCEGFPRGAALAALIEVCGRKERLDDGQALADEVVTLARSELATSREVMLELVGVHCARGGLLDYATKVTAFQEDEERRGAVEVAIVRACLEADALERARHTVSRINSPAGRVRGGALLAAAMLPHRGHRWALRQVKVLLELGDMRHAPRLSYLSLVETLFTIVAFEPAAAEEMHELFSEVLDILEPVMPQAA